MQKIVEYGYECARAHVVYVCVSVFVCGICVDECVFMWYMCGWVYLCAIYVSMGVCVCVCVCVCRDVARI